MMEIARVDMFEVEELACKIMSVDYYEIDADTQIIEEKLYDEFGIDLENFANIISRLLPLIDVGESLFDKKVYKGFSDVKNNCWLIKTEVKKQR